MKCIYSVQILVSCCFAVLIAAASCEEEVKKVDKIDAVKEDEKTIEKRGLSHDFGDWHSSGHDDHHHHHHHEHIKTITIEKKVPVPYEVVKKIPYTVEKKIPYEVKVPFPQPYEVIKKYPVKVKEYEKYTVEVPKPYEVIKKVPYEVKVPVDKPYPVKGEKMFNIHCIALSSRRVQFCKSAIVLNYFGNRIMNENCAMKWRNWCWNP